MVDIQNENVLTFSKVPAQLEHILGRRPSLQLVYRWAAPRTMDDFGALFFVLSDLFFEATDWADWEDGQTALNCICDIVRRRFGPTALVDWLADDGRPPEAKL